MELVGSEFMDRLDYYHRAWLPARALVEDAIRRRFEVLPMLFGEGFKGWVEPWGKGRPGPLDINLPTQLRAQLCTPFLSLHPFSHMHSPICTPVTPHTVTLPCSTTTLRAPSTDGGASPQRRVSFGGGTVLFRWKNVHEGGRN